LPADTYLDAALLVAVIWLLTFGYAGLLLRLRSINRATEMAASRDHDPQSAVGQGSVVGQLERSVDQMLERTATGASELRRIAQHVAELAGSLGRCTSQMVQSGHDMGHGLSAQLAATMAPDWEMGNRQSEVDGNEDQLEQLQQLASEAATHVEELAAVLAEERKAACDIEVVVRDLHRQFEAALACARQLSNSSRGIDTLAHKILRIGRHTHVLALNAAIEAAHAEERGHGFSVVAEQVRLLATEAREAARSVADGSSEVRTDVENLANEIQAGQELLFRVLPAIEATAGVIGAIERTIDITRQFATRVQAASERHLQRWSALVDSSNRLTAAQERLLAQAGSIAGALQAQVEIAKDARQAAHELEMLASDLATTVDRHFPAQAGPKADSG
jgi:methyl-accepting chemotaxis protein